MMVKYSNTYEVVIHNMLDDYTYIVDVVAMDKYEALEKAYQLLDEDCEEIENIF